MRATRASRAFINNWDHVNAGMSTDPGENTLEQLFLKQMRQSSAMKVEMEHYDRMGKGHPDHSFDFLYKAVARIIERRRKAKNRDDVVRQLGGSGGNIKAFHAGSGDRREKKQQKRDRFKSAGRGPDSGGNSKACDQWTANGSCSYGNKCKFMHGNKDNR